MKPETEVCLSSCTQKHIHKVLVLRSICISCSGICGERDVGMWVLYHWLTVGAWRVGHGRRRVGARAVGQVLFLTHRNADLGRVVPLRAEVGVTLNDWASFFEPSSTLLGLRMAQSSNKSPCSSPHPKGVNELFDSLAGWQRGALWLRWGGGLVKPCGISAAFCYVWWPL